MWTCPRETIREIVSADPKRGLWVLAWGYGFSAILNSIQSLGVGQGVETLWHLLVVAALFAPFWGMFIFTVWGWVTAKVALLFKGVSDYQSARAAYAWSCLPLLAVAPLWFGLIFLYGPLFFYPAEGERFLSTGEAGLLFLILLAKLVLTIWALVLYIQAFAEVNRFSVLRSIGAIVVSGVAITALFALFWIVLVQLAGPHSLPQVTGVLFHF